MTGPSDPIEGVRWTDSYLLSAEIGYDVVQLRLREPSGAAVLVSALGHIGVSLVGFWDETVIETADLVDDHPFAERCFSSIAERYGSGVPDSGSPERNVRSYRTLVVTLADGASLLVSAAEFEAVRG
jgi:hypothetical protein